MVLARFVPHFQQQLLHLAAGLRVERAKRLVHQNDRRAQGQRARNRNPLLHTPGKRLRIGVLEAAQSDILHQLRHRLLAFLFAEPH